MVVEEIMKLIPERSCSLAIGRFFITFCGNIAQFYLKTFGFVILYLSKADILETLSKSLEDLFPNFLSVSKGDHVHLNSARIGCIQLIMFHKETIKILHHLDC